MKKIVIFEFQDVKFASRARKEAFSLVKAGYDVTLIAYSTNSFTPTKKISKGVKILESPIFVDPKKSAIRKYISVIVFNLILLPHFSFKKYDIYHAHDLKIIWLMKIAFLLHKKPIIYDAHELHLEKRSIKTKRDELLKQNDYRSEMFFVKNADLIIQANDKRAELFQKFYNVKKPLVICNHDNLKRPEIIASSFNIREEIGLQNEDWLMVYTGFVSIGGNQKLETVIKGLSLLPENFHFCTLGSVVSDSREKIMTLVSQFNVNGRVHLLNPVPSEEVVNVISSANIAIIPLFADNLNSRYSALNKVSQSLMAGLPIICSKYESLEELIFNNDSGVVGNTFDVNNPDDFAASVLEVTKNLNNYNEMKKCCKLLAEKEFNWENEEVKLIDAYSCIQNKN